MWRRAVGKVYARTRTALPRPYVKQIDNFRILARSYGQFHTIERWSSEDAEGNPIPWYTYPAIEYLQSLDYTDKRVFEYGSGNSSLFWAARARKVVTVEHDPEWFDKGLARKPENLELVLKREVADYVDYLPSLEEKWDVIVIDGQGREECARAVDDNLAADGMVILDNADWWKNTARFLREELDLIEVDFHGFTPINQYTSTTSVFFRRSFRFPPKGGVQPADSVAAVPRAHDD
jgi:hypothetical protein